MVDIFVSGADEKDEQGVWIAPDIGENRSLPEGKRAEVCITPMTGRDKLKIDHANLIKSKAERKIEDVAAWFNRREHAKMLRVLRDRVVGLRNWTRAVRKADGTIERVEIKTVEELIESCLAAKDARMLSVLDQIYAAIIDASALDELLSGESISPLGSS